MLQPPRDDERRVEDRDREHEQRQQEDHRRRRLQESLHRDGREQETEHERARVAHEDPRREEVVAEEADAGSGDDRGEDRRVGLAEREGEDRERDAGDPADAGGKAVHPVEEVDHVHHRDDPQDRERDADAGRQVDRAEEREGEVVDPDAEERRNRRRHDLAGELPAGPQDPEVVDRADDGRDGGAQEHAPGLAAELEERERRYEDPEEDRDAAEPGDRVEVQPATLGPVDDAEQPRHPADRGREQDHDQAREPGAVENLGMVAERVHQSTNLTSSRTAGRLRHPGPARCTPSRSARGRSPRRRCARRDDPRGRARCPPARRRGRRA